jgi:citrate synthase
MGESESYLTVNGMLTTFSLANQEVLRWILAMQKSIGDSASPEKITEYLWSTLKSGRVVPGYGHGVLRAPDPRFVALQQFCDARPELSSSPVIRLVKQVSEIAPQVLKEHGKVRAFDTVRLSPTFSYVLRQKILTQTSMPLPVSDCLRVETTDTHKT